jgi:hypothetical protein
MRSAMFEYLPGNVWNLDVVTTLNSGGLADEVDRACRPLYEKAAQESDMGTAESMAAWCSVADFSHAERMQSATDTGRSVEHQRSVDLMFKSLGLLHARTTKVEVPYVEEGVPTSLPAYFCDGSIDNRPSPAVGDLDGGPVK